MPLAQQIWKRSRDHVIFGLLMLVAISIFVSRNGPVLSTARAASLAITAPLDGLYAYASQFMRAVRENTMLREETAQLSAEVARLREARVENLQLRRQIGMVDTTSIKRVVGRVVSKDMTEQTNLLTINVGSRRGIEVGMPVINERGIVGKIVLVGRNYSVVMPHQNTQFRVPATVDDLGRDGVVRWDGTAFDRLTMEYVVKTEPVERGMLITTSAYSGVFPAGIPIGRVDTAFAARGRNDFIIHLTPAAPISEVGYVTVLLTRPDLERFRLEAAARDTLGVAQPTGVAIPQPIETDEPEPTGPAAPAPPTPRPSPSPPDTGATRE